MVVSYRWLEIMARLGSDCRCNTQVVIEVVAMAWMANGIGLDGLD